MSGALERRYRRLIRAYPARYRADRGEEIVATYLEGAAPDQRWPSPADVADVLVAGGRERLGIAGATGLLPGARLAAVTALALCGALAVVYLPLETQRPQWWFTPTVGPFSTVGGPIWLAWLAAVLGAVLLPGRWARWPVAASLALTAAAPAARLLDYQRPPLLVLLPQLALGAVALALPAHRGVATRLAVAAPAALAVVGGWWASSLAGAYGAYQTLARSLLPDVAALLLLGWAVAGVAFLARRDARVLWAGVLLLPAAGLLAVAPIAQNPLLNPDGNTAVEWRRLVIAGILVAVVSAGAFVGAFALAALAARRPAPPACPTCGRRT
ncbi:hypothetical protein [Rhizomonospora bruguierae]|uniref:hypothetical protein n=1 Tax=Rhizomonospora bruguierae TaxID=1581705 RepID=UPI001BD0BE98|nr:hypothetical protein [Micromonospora sp. NBRC 107566]